MIIDPHYEAKHSDSITDEIVLALVKQLDEGLFEPTTERDNFQYFETEPLYFEEKPYRLIWLLEQNSIYIGVINAYRR